MTYGYRGLRKSGVRPEEHAVVYSSKKEGPYFLDREQELTMKKPIRIELEGPSHKLDPTSRLNYAKVYTVEHNVKVLFLGRVAKHHEQVVAAAFYDIHPLLDPGSGLNTYRPSTPEHDFSHAQQADPSYPAAAMATSENPTSYPEESSSECAESAYSYSAMGAAAIAGAAGFALGAGTVVVYAAASLPP